MVNRNANPTDELREKAKVDKRLPQRKKPRYGRVVYIIPEEFGNFAVYEGQLYAIEAAAYFEDDLFRLVPPSLSEETK